MVDEETETIIELQDAVNSLKDRGWSLEEILAEVRSCY